MPPLPESESFHQYVLKSLASGKALEASIVAKDGLLGSYYQSLVNRMTAGIAAVVAITFGTIVSAFLTFLRTAAPQTAGASGSGTSGPQFDPFVQSWNALPPEGKFLLPLLGLVAFGSLGVAGTYWNKYRMRRIVLERTMQTLGQKLIDAQNLG